MEAFHRSLRDVSVRVDELAELLVELDEVWVVRWHHDVVHGRAEVEADTSELTSCCFGWAVRVLSDTAPTWTGDVLPARTPISDLLRVGNGGNSRSLEPFGWLSNLLNSHSFQGGVGGFLIELASR